MPPTRQQSGGPPAAGGVGEAGEEGRLFVCVGWGEEGGEDTSTNHGGPIRHCSSLTVGFHHLLHT